MGAPGQDEVIDVYLMALDVIAHNLANINTTAFKRLQVDFQEIPGQTDQELGLVQMGGAQLVGPLKKGHGAKAICTTRIFTAGMLRQTGQPLDVAIHGEGFFEVFLADGTTAYTRDGTFRRAADGRVTTADGLPLGSGFQAIPSGTTSVAINRDGAVVYSTSSGATSFQIQLRTFSNLAGLEAIGRNLYRETAASGSTEFGMPGRDGCGELVQGFLERSNVDVTEQLQELVRLQNAYDVYSTIAETERKLSLQLTKTLQANSVMHQ